MQAMHPAITFQTIFVGTIRNTCVGSFNSDLKGNYSYAPLGGHPLVSFYEHQTRDRGWGRVL